jgi:4-hydroxythreonine-4-phosphate dehydrogenase
MKKLPVGVTLGDPAGIGPEIVAKLLSDNDFRRVYPFIPIGRREILDDAFCRILKTDPPEYSIIEAGSPMLDPVISGESSARFGELSMAFIREGIEAIRDGITSAIVTAPINKHSIALAGYPFPGHTEYLGYLTGSDDFSMMLVSRHYRVITATTHIPVRAVAETITRDIILRAIKNAHNAGKLFGIVSPTVAVCALNPHAGDGGVIGDEEAAIIEPAIKSAVELGINATGPHPADSLLARPDRFDFAVSIYHDQGLIPIKMDSHNSGVNITLNLPIIRTSVDHGTAFDIAGKGGANPGSLRAAIETAHKIAERQSC